MSKDSKLIAVAVVLLVIAAGLIVRHFSASQASITAPPTKADIDKRVADIQNNPNMPAQAKAMAIGQIQAHSAGQTAPAPPR